MSVDVSVDTTKHVKPLAVAATGASTTSPAEKVSIHGAPANSKYKTMTKYTFYESGTKYVKVLLDFPDAKKLINRD